MIEGRIDNVGHLRLLQSEADPASLFTAKVAWTPDASTHAQRIAPATT